MKIYDHPLPYLITGLAVAIAIIMLFTTVITVLSLERDATGELPATIDILFWALDFKTAKNLGIAFWTIGPPVWFWFEYFWLFKQYSKPEHLEIFRHGQQVSASIWAGVIAFVIFAVNFNPLETIK